MKQVRFPLQERYSYLAKFYQDDELYGMYVWALNEDEVKSQTEYHRGKVTFKEITQEHPVR